MNNNVASLNLSVSRFLSDNVADLEEGERGHSVGSKHERSGEGKNKKKPTFLPCKATHYANRVWTLVTKLRDAREGIIKDHGGDQVDILNRLDVAERDLVTLFQKLYNRSSLIKEQ